MWILESNGDFLQGKRMWLKPGKKYLFGRVKKDGVRFAIDHKTVSRKHFVISVDNVREEDVGRIHARTRITITDENSKAGTNIDGNLIRGQTQELTNLVTSIRPGSCPHELVISWIPRALTFNLLKKELKSGVLKSKQERVRELDVKAISDFLLDDTTHLVVQKRNTPKGLQALIAGKPLVTDSFIDALIYAAAPTALEEEENLCPLEIDFDEAWPDPAQHLPARGKEPTSKPAVAYKPDPDRQRVFENFTFIFLEQNQHDTLLPPITVGHGKAILCKYVSGETTAKQLMELMRNANGKKHFGEENRSSDNGGTILVQMTDPDEEAIAITNLVALNLNQRTIEQGEFLDAILSNKASLLRQTAPENLSSREDNLQARKAGTSGPLNVDLPTGLQEGHDAHNAVQTQNGASKDMNSVTHSSSNGRLASTDTHSTPAAGKRTTTASSEETQRPMKRARFLPPPKSKFSRFDDDFDPNTIAAYEDEHDVPSDAMRHNRLRQEDVDQDASKIKKEGRSPRKRLRTPSPVIDEELAMDDGLDDDFLPGTAAMKKEKLFPPSKSNSAPTPSEALAPRKSKKIEKEIDVREAVKAHREAEEKEEQMRQDRNTNDLHVDESYKGPLNCVEIIGFDIPSRPSETIVDNKVDSERWDPKWNGRKNFKAFRRARDKTTEGDSAQSRQRFNHNQIIVPVVEIKHNTYGLGDKYWPKSSAEKEKEAKEKERRRRAMLRVSQGEGLTRESVESQLPERRANFNEDDSEDIDSHDGSEDSQVQTSPQLSRLQKEAAEVVDHEINVDAPRQTRAVDTQTQTQTGKKRAGSSSAGAVRTAGKRQRTLPVTLVHGSESDDSDDMKFKFGRGKRGAAAAKAKGKR